jgi:hypothetical protein
VPFTTVSLANTTFASPTSITLLAGDWDVSGTLLYTTTGVTFIGVGALQGGASLTNNGLSLADGNPNYPFAATNLTTNIVVPFGPQRVLLTASTIVYLVLRAGFTAGTVTAGGFIRARRFR